MQSRSGIVKRSRTHKARLRRSTAVKVDQIGTGIWPVFKEAKCRGHERYTGCDVASWTGVGRSGLGFLTGWVRSGWGLIVGLNTPLLPLLPWSKRRWQSALEKLMWVLREE